MPAWGYHNSISIFGDYWMSDNVIQFKPKNKELEQEITNDQEQLVDMLEQIQVAWGCLEVMEDCCHNVMLNTLAKINKLAETTTLPEKIVTFRQELSQAILEFENEL